ncbi:MAG: recombination mediator RecR [Corynebacterium pyruviciproducens]|uniref:Recombination protein RecR n=2 Tax=Corynebacterium pyruviciproducens TaxID=598660 RepID=S2Z131_9CORY|nr:recombination mediator RecR [Corynebacterium pyruviciproducens]EPD68000.1 recombination protein recR [Corynebacterium pyruviciproducens ATCC BAA-1742]MDK6567254.1 recombination mediator RecR [Corynebacterium pyruviciproducens]MDK7215498.1 recombination mediator RecR [Corynebacterium pyruviciproducens]WOT01848.1 recombination mediator RecR [Corynebacterium pyruviciproducens]
MFEGPFQELIDEFSRLPGIGPKSAQRIAFYLINTEDDSVERLISALAGVENGISFCRICCNISSDEVCSICANEERDASTICVVEEPKDIQVIERTGEYNGRYHVLGGALDPLGGIGPKELSITQLVKRVGGSLPDVGSQVPEISEVILATDPNTEGEATASYLARLLKDFSGLTVSRLASGMPLGGDLEFVDELTLSRALTGRLTI